MQLNQKQYIIKGMAHGMGLHLVYNKSAITDHFLQENRGINWEEVKIYRERHKKAGQVKEAMWMRHVGQTMNQGVVAYNLPHIYDVIIAAVPLCGS